MRTLYIVKAGSTFAPIAHTLGDFEHWIATGLAPAHVQAAQRPAGFCRRAMGGIGLCRQFFGACGRMLPIKLACIAQTSISRQG